MRKLLIISSITFNILFLIVITYFFIRYDFYSLRTPFVTKNFTRTVYEIPYIALNKLKPLNEKDLVAPFVPTPQYAVDKMLEVANPTSQDILYDLGSGDGRFVISAAKKFGTKAIGIEINPELVKISRQNILNNKVDNLAEIRQMDILDLDFSDATIITMYLMPDAIEALVPKFKKLNKGTRIISFTFPIPGLKIYKQITVYDKGKKPSDLIEYIRNISKKEDLQKIVSEQDWIAFLYKYIPVFIFLYII